LRRIDARREQLAAQLERQETIKQREVFAIEVAIDAHRNEVDLFFGRMERETDPSAIARVASTMPPFPSLDDVAEQARRGATAEFASLDGQAAASTEALASATKRAKATTEPAESASASEPVEAMASATAEAAAPESTTETETDDGSASDVEAVGAVSQSRLKGVMDPAASRDDAATSQPWEAPYAVSVAAGTGPAEEEAAPMSVGSTLLRTVRSIRPMARHDKDSGEGDAPH